MSAPRAWPGRSISGLGITWTSCQGSHSWRPTTRTSRLTFTRFSGTLWKLWQSDIRYSIEKVTADFRWFIVHYIQNGYKNIFLSSRNTGGEANVVCWHELAWKETNGFINKVSQQTRLLVTSSTHFTQTNNFSAMQYIAVCTNHERWPNTSFFWLYLVTYRLWVWSYAWCGCSAWFPCRSGARLQPSDPAIRWMFIITWWKYWLSWSLSPFCTGWPRPLEYKPRNRKVD